MNSKKSIFEFRMYGEPHMWEGGIDLREVSYDAADKTILIKADGTNNKTHKREQIQFHLNGYLFEELCQAFNKVIPQYQAFNKVIPQYQADKNEHE